MLYTAPQNELSILEFIHNIVETFDRYFESVVSSKPFLVHEEYAV